jgi:hypothetical protein
MIRITKTLLLCGLAISLSSCTFLEGSSRANHQNLCNQLKNRILMNGASYSDRLADQQRAELGKLNSSYHDQGCE